MQEDRAVSDTAVRLLAESLLSIAAHAMPDTYLASDSGCQLARAVLADAVRRATDAYFEDTCGDCVEGRCHWGGEKSRQSIELAAAGQDYEDPQHGRCGWSRHSTSVVARRYSGETFDETVRAWQAAKDADEVVAQEDDSETIWISRPGRGRPEIQQPWCSGYRWSQRCGVDRRHAPHGEGEQPAWFE